MDQTEYDTLLRRLTTLVVKLDERDEQIWERLEEQRTFNARVTAAIERLDVTLAAIKDLLGRDNGHV